MCIIFLVIFIINVRDQNVDDYVSMRDKLDSKFEYIGHSISDDRFKIKVFKCMKTKHF